MKQIINKGTTRNWIVTDETIDGLLIRINKPAGQALAADDLAKCNITVYTTLDGVKQIEITPTRMKFNDLYKVLFCNDYERGEDILNTQQSTDISTSFHVLPFKFGTPMNLTKGRGLFVEVENGGSVAFPATQFEIQVITSFCVGVEQYVPQIQRVLLDAGSVDYDEQFGNNITSICSEDITDIVELQLMSDKQNYIADETNIRSQIFDKILVNNSGYPNGSFFLCQSQNVPLNNVRMRLQFDASASRTLFVVRKITTPAMLTNAIKKASEHMQTNVDFIRSNSLK